MIRHALAASLILASMQATARTGHSAPWVEAPQRPSLNGESGTTWFSPVFTRRQGTYEALYSDAQDTRNALSGDFLVARFRYTYDVPIGDDGAFTARHDESITELVLDCNARFSGTLSTRYLLSGKEVRFEDNERNGDVLMMQMSNDAGTTVGDLCEFARVRGQK